MRLYKVIYENENWEQDIYLTVGSDHLNEVEKREIDKLSSMSLIFINCFSIDEVDGHKILVG